MIIEINIAKETDKKNFTVKVMKNLGPVIKQVTLEDKRAVEMNNFFTCWLKAILKSAKL